MAELIERVGAPGYIRSDNGPEFIAHSLGRWMAESQIKTLYIAGRMIAWKPEGSPIKGFTLEANDIFDAEHELVTAIARNGESGRRE